MAHARPPRYHGGMETTKNGIYWVNVVEAPVSVYAVTGENERELVATFNEPGTHSFPAMSSQTEFEGGRVGVITGPFDSTRTLGGKGAAGEQGPLEYLTPSTHLRNWGVYYADVVADEFDLSALYVMPGETARLFLYVRCDGGSVIFPGAWVFLSPLPSTLEAGTMYCITVFTDVLDKRTVANLAFTTPCNA